MGCFFSAGCPNDLFSGGFKYVLLSPLRWEDSHFDSYFSNGLKQPPSFIFKNCFWHVFIPIDNTSQFCWFEDVGDLFSAWVF